MCGGGRRGGSRHRCCRRLLSVCVKKLAGREGVECLQRPGIQHAGINERQQERARVSGRGRI